MILDFGAAWSAGQIVKSLQGHWRIDRSLQNIGSPYPSLAGTMKGFACFDSRGGIQTACTERGVLTLENGRSVHSSCSWYSRAQGGHIYIYFDSQQTRVFHVLKLMESASEVIYAESTHLCNADRYDSRYEFPGNGRFSVTHIVNGPRKSYVSCTPYHRL